MMPSLKLIQPLDSEHPDRYGYRDHFRTKPVAKLIAAYNSGVGSRAWTAARGEYLIALRAALLATGLDCSSFISDDEMSMDRPVTLRGRRIVSVD
jgi:hypothetical protein